MLIASEAVDAFSPSWFAEMSAGDAGNAVSGGRGGVRVFDSAIGPLIRRDYLRGGLPRFISRDRYVWTGAERTRAFAEFRLLQTLRHRGLRVPQPVAARYRRQGPAYRASLLMHFIPQTRSLADVLAAGSDPDFCLPIAFQAIAALHRCDVWHADLNATNVLVDDSSQVWLIDFDRARPGVADTARLSGNLERLRRSLRKLLPSEAFGRVESAWPGAMRRYHAALSGVSSAA